jgi:Domain of unknown function (DUF4276)
MKRVCVVCEGQTEEEFVLNVLAPAFYPLGINLIPEMIHTSPGNKGGGLSYERVKRHLRNTLRQSSAPTVTTLFDLYQLDADFPGFSESIKQPSLEGRLNTLNLALHTHIVQEAACAPERFIPFIQPYEFEALLFSDVPTLLTIEQDWHQAGAALIAARNAAVSPEHINDHPETKPAAHLERALKNPQYRKRRHGPIAAQKIGLNKIEAECAFFSGWMTQLRNLAKS